MALLDLFFSYECGFILFASAKGAAAFLMPEAKPMLMLMAAMPSISGPILIITKLLFKFIDNATKVLV